MASITVEIVAQNAEDARAAERGGADRIELVADFEVGGVTPDVDVIRDVKQAVSIPVYVMIRPRSGDFVYDGAEIAAMVDDARLAVDAGADGLVLGALREGTPDRLVPRVEGNAGRLELDLEAIVRIVAATHVPITLHRAFDELDPEGMQRALKQLAVITYVERVLTSGGAPNVEDGLDVLAELVELSGAIGLGAGAGLDRSLSIMPGGRVTPDNANDVVRATGVREIHLGTAVREPATPDGVVSEALVRKLRAATRKIRS